MSELIKALIVILVIASMVSLYFKNAFTSIIPNSEFNRWRNTWFAMTLSAFLAHNFWLFIIFCISLLVYLVKSEQNRFALYLAIVAAVPTINARIPGLFDITYIRALSLILFLPLLISFKRIPDTPRLGKPLVEKLMISFMLLSTLLEMRGTTVTDSFRYGIYGLLDYFLPYYAASRLIKDFEQLKKAMIALVMGCMLAGALGVIEFIKYWLLYNPIPSAMNISWDMGAYLGRGNNIRAISSLGHSLILGFYMMIGFGFYLYVGKFIKNKYMWLAGLGLLIGGLISPLARGSWLGTFVLLLTFIAFGPKIFKRFSVAIIVSIIAIQSLYWIPGGEKILNLLPFIGNVDTSNISYREKLLTQSWLVIQQYPIFGVYDATLLPEMQEMVQGEGIVDIVNSYLGVALSMGLVGLSLFVGIFITTLTSLRKSMNKIVDKNSDEYLCGRSLMASLVAIILTITTVSGVGIIPTLYWSVIGLIFSYAKTIKPSKIAKLNDFPTIKFKSNL